jgi:hypothetical protein
MTLDGYERRALSRRKARATIIVSHDSSVAGRRESMRADWCRLRSSAFRYIYVVLLTEIAIDG